MGVQVEDEDQSVAVHDRQARERRLALSALDELRTDADPALRIFPGRMVLKVVPAAAPPNWLTVRVGREDPYSRARFFLDSTREVAMLLERLLVHLGQGGTGPAGR